MAERFRRFSDFYPFYLSEHCNRTCRRLHFVGTACVVLILIYVLASGEYLWLLAAPLAGYAFAWVGHFAFEKNRPATFSYPWYSLLGDWVMFKDILTRRIPF
jgi:hypothetical protein